MGGHQNLYKWNNQEGSEGSEFLSTHRKMHPVINGLKGTASFFRGHKVNTVGSEPVSLNIIQYNTDILHIFKVNWAAFQIFKFGSLATEITSVPNRKGSNTFESKFTKNKQTN